MSNPTIKGISFSESSLDGSSPHIAIVHARWNKPVIDTLVQSAAAYMEPVRRPGMRDWFPGQTSWHRFGDK